MKHIDSGIAELKGKVDFGIITIREDEFEAVLQRLPAERLVTGRQAYVISRLQTSNQDEYVIALARCIEPGNGQAQTVARDLIEDLNPQWILLVGIAGSIPDYEYTLGDVILASRLHDFSISASIEIENQQTRQQFSSRGGPMHPDVQKWISLLPALPSFLEPWNTREALTVTRPEVKFTKSNFYGDPQWNKKVRECLTRYFGKDSIRQHSKAVAVPVASSDILVKNTKLVTQWLDTTRDIKAVEMELAGVYQAAFNADKPVLAIRGISDIVGFKRSPDWTSYACHAAASFLAALLRFRPIVPLSVQKAMAIRVEESTPVSLQTQPVGVFKRKPPNLLPIKKPERLYTNLLEVTDLPERMYAVETKCKKSAEVWALLKEKTDDPPGDWIYRGKMLYAFHDFSDPIWKVICEGHMASPEERRHWSDSTEQDRISEFIELLKGCLREFAKTKGLHYIYKQKVKREKKSFKYLYYPATSHFSESPLFRQKDFIDVAAIIESFKDDEDLVVKHLFAQLLTNIQGVLEESENVPDEDLLAALVDGFNHLLRSPIYDPAAFDDVYLRVQTLRTLEKESDEESHLMYLNRLLLEDVYDDEIEKRYFADRTIVKKSLIQARERTVFKAYFAYTTGKFSYYRHHAFRYQFLRLEGKWYLEITPTYHYTRDGYRVSSFYEDLVKGIKRIESNEAVFRQVMFWSKVLQHDKTQFFEEQSYPYFKFGGLLEFPFDYGVVDGLWTNKESISKASDDTPKRGRRPRGKRGNKQQSDRTLFG